MIKDNQTRYIIGFCIGILLTSGINALQPRQVNVTITEPIKAELEIEPLLAEALE